MSAIGDAFVTIRPDASKFAGETEGFFKANAAKFALIGTGIGAAIAGGVAALKLGESFDAAFDTIRLGTGATGEALKGLEADFKGVFKSVPTDAETASTAIADLNTRLGLTGEPLQEMATQFINLSRITGTDLGANIADLTRVFGDWSVASDDQAGVMDAVFRASQASGIGINQLAQKVVQFGAPLRQMGFGLDESIALLSKWEKEGVNGELVLGSLRIAMGNFARDNVPMREGLDETIRRIQEMGPGAEATALAMEVFGARAGPDMAAAILEGRFAVDEYLAAISGGSETINQAAADTDDWREQLTVLKNQALIGLEPILSGVFNVVGALATVTSTRLVPAFQAHVLPVLQAFAGFLTGVVVPAVQAHVMPLLQRFAEHTREQFAKFQRYYSEHIKPAVENIQRLVVWLVGEVRERWPQIERVIRPVLENVQNVVETVFGVVTGVLDAVIRLIGGDFSGAWNAMKDVVRVALDGVRTSLVNGIALIKGLLGLFVDLGKDLMQGFIEGIKSMAGSLVATIQSSITDRIPGFVKKALGIHSPSTVFAGIGEQLMAGLGAGISTGYPRVARLLDGITSDIPGIVSPTSGVTPPLVPTSTPTPPLAFQGEVHVYLGERELTELVRVEVREEQHYQQTRGARLAGARV
ncbi:MAG: phage tail tape measure protein [Desulfuromonadales bacterium]